MLEALSKSAYPKEPCGILFEGKQLCASQFTENDFKIVCDHVGMSRNGIGNVMQAYEDNTQLMPGNRRSGEPNWHHPVGVALVEMLEFENNDPERIIAALMHDVVEDSKFFVKDGDPFGDLKAFYGERVAKIVMAVTQPINPISKSEMEQDERKTYLEEKFRRVAKRYPEIAKDACELKIADRMFNLRTEFEEDRLFQKLKDTHAYLIPIASHAGPKYEAALKNLYDKLMAECRS